MKRIAPLIFFIGILAAGTIYLTASQKVGAQSARMFDGGETEGIEEECTCSGSTLLMFRSYVDQSTHEYIYEPGVTTLYANYNPFTAGGYFLDTHFPFGICLVEEGEDCSTEGDPEGTLTKIGTS